MAKAIIDEDAVPPKSWLVRLGWLVAYWAGGVGTLAVVAYGIRLLMSAAGMTTH